MLTAKQAYKLGFEHGSEMARESGSNNPGCEGWDGMLINADPRFAQEELGWGSENESIMDSYTKGCQSGADAAFGWEHGRYL